MSLISSLGGALSLYLGISIIVGLEIVEYLILLFINLGRFFLGSVPGNKLTGDKQEPEKSDTNKLGSNYAEPIVPVPVYEEPKNETKPKKGKKIEPKGFATDYGNGILYREPKSRKNYDFDF